MQEFLTTTEIQEGRQPIQNSLMRSLSLGKEQPFPEWISWLRPVLNNNRWCSESEPVLQVTSISLRGTSARRTSIFKSPRNSIYRFIQTSAPMPSNPGFLNGSSWQTWQRSDEKLSNNYLSGGRHNEPFGERRRRRSDGRERNPANCETKLFG